MFTSCALSTRHVIDLEWLKKHSVSLAEREQVTISKTEQVTICRMRASDNIPVIYGESIGTGTFSRSLTGIQNRIESAAFNERSDDDFFSTM